MFGSLSLMAILICLLSFVIGVVFLFKSLLSKDQSSKTNIVMIVAFCLSGIMLLGSIWNGLAIFLEGSEWKMHEPMTDSEKEQYCSMALVPDLKEYCVRYGERTFNRKYKRICVECAAYDFLPEKYQKAMDLALKSDEYIITDDFDHNGVRHYTINDGLALADKNSLPSEYSKLANRVTKIYYQVMVYDSGRKVLIFWFEYDL